MEQEKIRELIGRYYRGETSEEEELTLRKYLGSVAAPASMTDEDGYLAIAPERMPEPSEDFDARLEAVTRTETRVTTSNGRRRLLAIIGTAAAAVAGLWLIFSQLRSPGNGDTFSDPDLAMAEVKSILLTVSENMNAGTTQLQQVGTITVSPDELNSLRNINGLVGKNLSRLRYLDGLKPEAENKETK